MKHTVLVNGNASTEMIFSDLSEDIDYIVNVTAINRNNAGETLDSIPKNHTFFYLGMSGPEKTRLEEMRRDLWMIN